MLDAVVEDEEDVELDGEVDEVVDDVDDVVLDSEWRAEPALRCLTGLIDALVVMDVVELTGAAAVVVDGAFALAAVVGLCVVVVLVAAPPQADSSTAVSAASAGATRRLWRRPEGARPGFGHCVASGAGIVVTGLGSGATGAWPAWGRRTSASSATRFDAASGSGRRSVR